MPSLEVLPHPVRQQQPNVVAWCSTQHTWHTWHTCTCIAKFQPQSFSCQHRAVLPLAWSVQSGMQSRRLAAYTAWPCKPWAAVLALHLSHQQANPTRLQLCVFVSHCTSCMHHAPEKVTNLPVPLPSAAMTCSAAASLSASGSLATTRRTLLAAAAWKWSTVGVCWWGQ